MPFMGEEAERIKEAIESKRKMARELSDEAAALEVAWEDGDREGIRAGGIDLPYVCFKCGEVRFTGWLGTKHKCSVCGEELD